VTHLLVQHGLIILFALVAMESAGVPLPGETALIAAAILASQGHYGIEWVIAIAATAAIIGDNVGYWIGRQGGRTLLERWEPVARHAQRVLPPAERFFERHGGKTVFIARFVAFLRVTAAWIAGVTKMPWWRFFLWNAAGGICWAVAIGLVAYESGKAAADAISHFGLYAAGAIGAVVAAGAVIVYLWRRRSSRRPGPSTAPDEAP